MNRPLGRRAVGAAYRIQQECLRLQCLAAQQALRAATGRRDRPPPEVLRQLRSRYRALLDRDRDNVARGHYPARLLFSFPALDYARAAPRLLRELPLAARRMKAGAYKDLPEGIDLRAYPPYYRRTFHWQTDGYLSDRSARIYDLSVELLFLGTADVMRRQVIPPIAEAAPTPDGAGLRVLDVGCGTARTLAQLGAALPEAHLHGLDLSPYYLDRAVQTLKGHVHTNLTAGNAEDMPYEDRAFDAVASVHLFHELPRNARRRVIGEMLRVLRPGGVLVIEDAAQLSESDELAYVLGRFSQEFHEPFFEDYLRDPIEVALEEAGFEIDSVAPHFVSKAVVARRPSEPPQL